MNVTSDGKREKARQIKRRKKTKRKTNQCEIKDNCNRTKQKSTSLKAGKEGKEQEKTKGGKQREKRKKRGEKREQTEQQ